MMIWNKDYEMRPTKRAVIDVGRACNAKCIQCYYRYETFDSKDADCKKIFQKTLLELKQEVVAALNRGCDSVDFTGGEPTIHPNIVEVITFCKERGLEPRIITNAQASEVKILELIGAGCKDWLISMHDIDDRLEKIMQVPKAWENMARTIDVIKRRKAKFAINTVIIKQNYQNLPEIAQRAVDLGAYLFNFINCNPLYGAEVKELKEVQCKVSESKPYIEQAIDILEENLIWANLRYYPMCVLDKSYRKHIVDHPQVMFDWRNEWDYSAYPKDVETYLKFGREAFQYKSNSQDGVCGKCPIKNVCGGLNLGYKSAYGEEEITSFFPSKETPNDYPFLYRAQQEECDIIIPAYKIKHNLSRLLEEILHKTQGPYNIILIHSENSAGENRNKALARSKARFIIFVDDDIAELPYLWNKLFIDRLTYNPDIMAISARLLDVEGNPAVNSANNFDMKEEVVEVNMIPTACVAFRRNMVNCDLFFDPKFIKSGWEDTDFFSEMKKRHIEFGYGSKIIIDNNIKVVHLHTATGYDEFFDYNKQVFEENEARRLKDEQKTGSSNDEKKGSQKSRK